jgi:hypothetical protein
MSLKTLRPEIIQFLETVFVLPLSDAQHARDTLLLRLREENMNEPKWIQVPVRGSAIAARMAAPPPGPYFLVPQSQANQFEMNPTKFDVKKVDVFTLEWGYVTYALAHDYMPMKVGYHYDTSD